MEPLGLLIVTGILFLLTSRRSGKQNLIANLKKPNPAINDKTYDSSDQDEASLREIRNSIGNKANRSLEKRLKKRLAAKASPPPSGNTASNTVLMIIGGSALLFGVISIGYLSLEGLKQSSNSTPNQANSSYQSTATPSKEPTRQPIEQARTPERIDPAAEVKPFITTYLDQRFPNLNDMDQYKRGTGDLARVQERMLRYRDKSRQYPHIIIGNGEFTGHCSVQGPTIGVYRLDCKTIQINFTDGNTYYEYPIEILATLAHEYAHHLVNITIGTKAMSGLENELLADCFAGLMIGYWDKYSKVSEQEVRASAEMMIQVSKKEGLNFTDNHGDPGQRLGAFLGGAMRAAGKPSPHYENFCRSLDRIIDWEKGLP